MSEHALKHCSVCKRTKPPSEFNNDQQKSDGLASLCRQCASERQRKHYRKHRKRHQKRAQDYARRNPERIRAAKKKYDIEHRELHRRYALKRIFGITPEQWTEMFGDQNGCCAICGRPQMDFKKRFHVDHDHETGKVRGLLCYRCNSMLGMACDDPVRLQAAISYLRRV